MDTGTKRNVGGKRRQKENSVTVKIIYDGIPYNLILKAE